jgi:hypothetical protein
MTWPTGITWTNVAPSEAATFRYVNHDRVFDYARLGWCLADLFGGCYHGEFSVLMVWICKCPLAEPTSRDGLPISSYTAAAGTEIRARHSFVPRQVSGDR